MSERRSAWDGPLEAPFPWFGGKSRVAAEVWERFGDVRNYVEPFFGSGAVLFGRPTAPAIETVNDLDGLVANFWRAVKLRPDETADWADSPVNENDLHARHSWLLGRIPELRPRLEGDPDWCDPKVAGWWVWGLCCWIGSGWCSGAGPWRVVDGLLVDSRDGTTTDEPATGLHRKRPHLLNAGKGVNRKLPHLGDGGRGINKGAAREWFSALSARLARVRVCSGDWSRVVGPSVTFKHGLTGVFLDPPYADTANRDADLYREDCLQVAHSVREWALEAGKRPDMRIALCGYEGEHQMPPEWSVLAWKAPGGYGSQAEERSGNERRERIWFSPARLDGKGQRDLFEA